LQSTKYFAMFYLHTDAVYIVRKLYHRKIIVYYAKNMLIVFFFLLDIDTLNELYRIYKKRRKAKLWER